MCLVTVSGKAGTRVTYQPAAGNLETRHSSSSRRGRSHQSKSPVASSCPITLLVPTCKGLQLSL